MTKCNIQEIFRNFQQSDNFFSNFQTLTSFQQPNPEYFRLATKCPFQQPSGRYVPLHYRSLVSVLIYFFFISSCHPTQPLRGITRGIFSISQLVKGVDVYHWYAASPTLQGNQIGARRVRVNIQFAPNIFILC